MFFIEYCFKIYLDLILHGVKRIFPIQKLCPILFEFAKKSKYYFHPYIAPPCFMEFQKSNNFLFHEMEPFSFECSNSQIPSIIKKMRSSIILMFQIVKHFPFWLKSHYDAKVKFFPYVLRFLNPIYMLS